MDHIRLGQSLRALRLRRGWTQERLAAVSSVPRCTISSVETGSAAGARLGSLERIAEALGARLDLALRWRGEALDRLLDEAHASLVDSSVRLLTSCGWEVVPEVSFNVWGERGSIDLLAFHRPTSVVLVVEVKSAVPDLQAMLATLDRKARLARAVAEPRGWRAVATARLLVLGDTRTNHRRVATHAPTLGASLPGRGGSLRAWLSHPRLPAVDGLCYMPFAANGDVRGRGRHTQRVRVRVPRSQPQPRPAPEPNRRPNDEMADKWHAEGR